ncbi:trypsin-like peptidase domain-containing protein [Thalassoglobus sp.]|uniref:trypsin-like peptidase domain-containing protein n=1 Tax=Thalassoglobus sp. TaxID=2795869 RepID=UPI003AA886F1
MPPKRPPNTPNKNSTGKPPVREKRKPQRKSSGLNQVSPLVLIGSCILGSFLAVVAGILITGGFQSKTDERVAAPQAINENEPPPHADVNQQDMGSASESSSHASANNSELPQIPPPKVATQSHSKADEKSVPNPDEKNTADSSSTPAPPISQTRPPIDTNANEEIAEEQTSTASDGLIERVKDEVAVLPPPIPQVLTEISSSAFSSARKAFKQQTSARNAFILYEAFSKSYEFDEFQLERVNEELAEWRDRSEKNLYRLGTQWVTKDVRDKAVAEGNQIIEAGLNAISAGNIEGAVALFEQASRANPNGIRADYMIGLIYSLPFSNTIGPKNAQEHFERVVRRNPTHGAALNSLGIAQVKQNDYLNAFHSFRMASEVLPKCPEVIHNLSRVISLTKRKRLSPTEQILQKYESLFAELVASEKSQHIGENTGWLHMPPVFDQEERDEKLIPNQAKDEVATAFIKLGSGSGFLVKPNYYLTNRHVAVHGDLGVADKIGVIISSPGGDTEEKFGQVVAVSKDVDLALLHVAESKGTPLPLLDVTTPLASDVLILGYPLPAMFGSQLKATQGIVSGLPDQSRRDSAPYYFFDAIADHGNSGGPILDRQGRVASILTIGIPDYYHGTKIEAKFTGGVPSIDAIKFLKKHLDDFPPDEIVAHEKQEWADLVAKYSQGIVKVQVYYKSGVPNVAKADARSPEGYNVLEDKTCIRCSGRALLQCNVKGCVNGKITQTSFRSGSVGLGNNRKIARVPVYNSIDCRNCRNGLIKCPDCKDGLDLDLQ